MLNRLSLGHCAQIGSLHGESLLGESLLTADTLPRPAIVQTGPFREPFEKLGSARERLSPRKHGSTPVRTESIEQIAAAARERFTTGDGGSWLDLRDESGNIEAESAMRMKL